MSNYAHRLFVVRLLAQKGDPSHIVDAQQFYRLLHSLFFVALALPCSAEAAMTYVLTLMTSAFGAR